MSDFEFREENTIEAVFSMEVGREMNDHNKLYNRYADDQHPISAITGLTEALAEGSSNLQAEISRAEAAEQALDDKIEAETTRAEGAESGLNTAIGNETTARIQADITLQTNITAEENRAKGVENGLRSDLTAETTARENADTGLQGQITTNANDIDSIEDKIPSEASSSNQLADKLYVDTADSNLQSQIDAISASSDVTDIVGTYAELQAYDTSTLTNDDIIKVLQDESQGGATTYYRWVVSGSSGSFVLIGSEGPYYTKAEADELYDEKQDEITATNKLDSDLVDDNGQTNKFVTASEKAQITTNANNITDLQTNKADKSTTYTKTEVDTIATGKANVGLDNLNASGQMIIDSQNGTISNCILEIPQNLKLSIVNNVVTLDIGSIVTLFGNTYSTYTTTTTKTWTTPNTNGRYMLFATVSADEYIYSALASRTFSGTTYPDSPSFGDIFFDTSDKSIHRYTTQWVNWGVGYPIAIADITNGVVSFAKDSNGNDMIFNGMGFIGHHIFCYPNVRYLCGNGLENGKLLSYDNTVASLTITEMDSGLISGDWFKAIIMRGNNNTNSGTAKFRVCEKYSDLLQNSARLQYVEEDNICYVYSSSGYTSQPRIYLCTYEYDGTTVTKFDIRQPYEGARNLLTDSLQVDVTTLTGYDSTQTQTLKNINGVLTWVTD